MVFVTVVSIGNFRVTYKDKIIHPHFGGFLKIVSSNYQRASTGKDLWIQLGKKRVGRPEEAALTDTLWCREQAAGGGRCLAPELGLVPEGLGGGAAGRLFRQGTRVHL